MAAQETPVVSCKTTFAGSAAPQPPIEIGQRICANGPLAVKATLRTLRETNGMRENEALEHEFTYGWDVFGSEDAKEGPRAFKEKRTPNFQGK